MDEIRARIWKMPERCERVAKDEAAMKSELWYYEGLDEVFDGVRLPPLGNDFFLPLWGEK